MRSVDRRRGGRASEDGTVSQTSSSSAPVIRPMPAPTSSARSFLSPSRLGSSGLRNFIESSMSACASRGSAQGFARTLIAPHLVDNPVTTENTIVRLAGLLPVGDAASVPLLLLTLVCPRRRQVEGFGRHRAAEQSCEERPGCVGWTHASWPMAYTVKLYGRWPMLSPKAVTRNS
eukprot:1808630-Prymnesium_polylepis.1